MLAWSGESLIVSQVATAAGVAEATVFKVFPTRDSLIQACLDSAIDTKELETALTETREIDVEDQLANLKAMATPLREYFLNALRITRAIGSPKANDLAHGTKRLLDQIDHLIASEFRHRPAFQKVVINSVAFELVFVSSVYSSASRELAGMSVPPMDDLLRVLLDGANPNDVSKREN